MSFKSTIYTLFVLMLFSSCSGLVKKKTIDEKLIESTSGSQAEHAELTEAQKQEKIVEAFRILDKRMKELVSEASKEGEEAIKFLASDLFIKANDASMRGDAHTSAYLYKYLLSLKPKDKYVRKKYSIELIRMGSLEEAKVMLQMLLDETKFADETLGLILGGVHTALDEKEQAREVYQNVLNVHSGSEESCVFLAKSFGMNDQFSKAHKLLNKCMKKADSRGIFSYYKGKLYIKQEKRTLAKRSFQKALKLEPEYHQAAMALGLMAEEKQNHNEAIQIYKKFIDKNPNNFAVMSRLVQVLFANEKFKDVLPYAERLSSLDPSDLNLRVRLGILYTDDQQFSKAIGVFKEILAAVPNSDKVLYYLGSLYQQTKDLEKALSSFGKISEESSLYVDSSMQIAKILQALVQSDDEKWSQEYQEYLSERSHKVDELEVEFHMMLATYYEGQKEYSDAIGAIEKVRNIKDYTEGHDYYLASLYEKIKDYSKARNIVRDILNKNPQNAHALNFLGYSMLENNEDLDEAFNLINKAVKLSPKDGYIRDSLGWYYYKTGQIYKALEEVKKAFELEKSDVVIAKHLAIIYRDLKKFEKAKEYFVEALKNCKLESERQEVMDALGNLEKVRLPASQSSMP